jgi:hypothetical protein
MAMAPENEGGHPPRGAANPPIDHPHHHDQATCPGSSGEGQQGACAEGEFIGHLPKLGIAVWVARHGSNEFIRPRGWQKLTPEGNDERLARFQLGMALRANTGGVLVVVDVDARNDGDVEKVRALLIQLKVRVFAEVLTPSGGRHFYVAGHPELPSVHSTLPRYPGVDIQSFGCNVFLPGTQRPKYQGGGYSIVFDDLGGLAGGDAQGTEALAQWVAESLGDRAKRKASKRDAADLTFTSVPPWAGGKPDARQQGWLDKYLRDSVKAVARAVPGGRNDALYLAALKCSSLVAGAGMDAQLVTERLLAAAQQCGLVDDDGAQAVCATMGSAFRVGAQHPRAVPEHGPQRLDDAHIGERIADDYLAARFVHSSGLGWLQFDGRRWKRVAEPSVAEAVPTIGRPTLSTGPPFNREADLASTLWHPHSQRGV